ncbi:unnamed protein product, partial [Discosporangium mesarthrocarpum]
MPSQGWEGQEWLLGEVLSWIGAEEFLNRVCNVSESWRRWCNTGVTVLELGNAFQRRPGRRAGLCAPMFLPLVPSSLCELNISGTWTAVPARELGVIRRGCNLRKLVLAGVRLYSFSYRELMLFENLEELDISHTDLDVQLPLLRFPCPAGSEPAPGPGPCPGEEGEGEPLLCPKASEVTSDMPRFAGTLRQLTAVSTRLWSRWDLSAFPSLRALEVSWAGRMLLEQLHRKSGSSLTDLSVCDVCLRNLVRATNFHQLADSVGSVSTFRLRRVDVVKEVPQFAYLRGVLARLKSLQVLELTGVSLDDAMLVATRECLPRSRPPGPTLKTGLSTPSPLPHLPRPHVSTEVVGVGVEVGARVDGPPPTHHAGLGEEVRGVPQSSGEEASSSRAWGSAKAAA